MLIRIILFERMRTKSLIKTVEELNKIYKVRVERSDPFRVLIGVMLSHRTTDKISWPATDRLFEVANTPEKILRLSTKRIQRIIYPVGFYRIKSKRIKKVCQILLKKYGGRVPRKREELMSLPGVGGKSADIVLSFGFGKSIIAVDTHVAVISRRWHLTKEKNPEKIRNDLMKKVPLRYRLILNQLLVQFGRDYCTARYPKCKICPVQKLCPYENKNL